MTFAALVYGGTVAGDDAEPTAHVPETHAAARRSGCVVGCNPLLLVGVVLSFVLDAPTWLRTSLVVLMVLSMAVSVRTGATQRPPLTGDTAKGVKYRLEARIRRFQKYGLLSSLHRAVRLIRLALDATPPGHPDRGWYLDMLDHALQLMYLRTGDVGVLKQAVDAGREAMAATPPTDPHRASCLGTLALSLIQLYGIERDPELLDEAVRVAREAVASSEADDPMRASYMTNLGFCLLLLFARDLDPRVLDESVRVARNSVAATLPDDPDPSGYLITLSINLTLVYAFRGDLAALEEAVDVARQAAAAKSGTRLERSGNLANLSGSLFQLAARRSDPELLAEAIRVCREAIATTPRGHHNRATLMTNLSTGLRNLATHDDDPAPLRDAVQIGREAVDSTPHGHPNRSTCLLGLGLSLHALYQQGRDVTHLEEAVQRCREATQLVPADLPNRVHYLVSLGSVLRSQFEESGNQLHLTEARKLLATAAEAPTMALNSLSAAQQAADLDLLAGAHKHAVAMAEKAVRLLPQVRSRRIGRADRQHRVTGFAGLASTAAAAAIAAGKPNRAVELLEQTRGLTLADSFDVRGDVTELRDKAPELAEEFEHLRSMIEVVDHVSEGLNVLQLRPSEPAGHELLANQRAGLDEQWTDLVGRVRARPGLESFLLPPPVDLLRRQAVDGPIVYVLAHHRRGNALVVVDDQKRPVRVVDLPEFTQENASEQAGLLRNALQAAADRVLPAAERRAAQEQVLETLEWLWENVTEPVLRSLGHTTTPAEGTEWPRLWWCPVGVSTLLPLHAAGRHTDGESVLDRVISSYTPTIRALGHARTRRDADDRTRPSMAIVAVPDAPHSPLLHGVAREAELLQHLVPAATLLPSPGTTTTHDAVTSTLADQRIAHFACHGIADLVNPANSRLLLHDHLERPLTVAAVAKLRLDHGELAYLSACSTTGTDRRHADEAAHLAAAFQLAGYRSVIGTLWPINDHAATAIAEDFYTYLTHERNGQPDSTLAATALHHTIRRRRARYPTLPTRWAAHLHVGV